MADHRKEVIKLIRKLRKLGWKVVIGGSKHYKCFHPSGEGMVVISSSPSCDYWKKNAIGDLKRIDKDIKL